MAGLVTSLAGLAAARVRGVTRRARMRATLIVLAAFMALLALGFGLAAATAALAAALGLVRALLVMAGLALFVLLVLVAMLGAEARKARRLAAQRDSLDRDLARAALAAAAPSLARPPRTIVGLALVALGALLVLRERRGR